MRAGHAQRIGYCHPEVLWQDLVAAQLFEQEYGQDFGLGTGFTDASFPGTQSVAEKSLRFWVSAMSGRTSCPVGILSHGKRFSPEQAMLDLEIARYIDRYLLIDEVNDETLGLDLIQQVGIGGSFIAEEHPARNFRHCLWQPALFDRGMSRGLGQERAKDAVADAQTVEGGTREGGALSGIAGKDARSTGSWQRRRGCYRKKYRAAMIELTAGGEGWNSSWVSTWE